MSFYEPITLKHQSSLEERQIALRQIYQQVLERQPYEDERSCLAKAEKDFLAKKIGVKRFLTELALSKLYLDSFYYQTSNVKFLESCFKHFLGRAPLDHQEIGLYCDILIQKGLATMVSTLLDSEEYRKAFGCFTVPYPQKHSTYASPKAYLESELLNQEHIGQWGYSLPILYWRQLGLICAAGVCRHPEADEDLVSNVSQADLMRLTKLLQYARPQEIGATLSSEQKEMLRQVMAKL
jgi:hypothetical protein